MPTLVRLQEEIQLYHEKLERNPFGRAVLDHTLSQENYTTMLTRLYGFYHPIELLTKPFKSELEQLGLDCEQWRKAPLLKTDLTALGCTFMGVLSLPMCPQLPRLDTLPRVLGCLYVLEEMTQVGQAITNELRAALNLTTEHGATFLNSFTNTENSIRQSFATTLRGYVEAHEDEIVAAACETMIDFDNWLTAAYFIEA